LFGASSLTHKLMNVLGKRIEATLPVLRDRVSIRLRELDRELSDMGDGPPQTEREKVRELSRLIQIFTQSILGTIKGTKIPHQKVLDHEPFGSMFFRRRFSQFAQLLESKHNISDAFDDDYVRNIIENSHGSDLPGFDSFEAFHHLVLHHHKKLLAPSRDCADEIIAHVRDDIMALYLDTLQHFPFLQDIVKEKATEIIEAAGDTACEKVQDFISTFDCIYTSDQEYVEISTFTEKLMEVVVEEMDQLVIQKETVKGKNALINREEASVETMKKKLVGYDKCVRKSVIEAIPRIIGKWFFLHLQEEMQLDLDSMVSEDFPIDELMLEPEDINERRQALVDDLGKVQAALAILRKPFQASK